MVGERFNISGKGGEPYTTWDLIGTWHFIGELDKHLETMLCCLTLMSGYLYLSNNLKDIKEHI